MQGLSDALADVGEGTVETPAEEYAMMLEVMMADRPGWPHPPTFSWNAIWTHVERLFQSGFHALPTLPLASFLWWRCGGKQLLPPTAEG